ncbi:NAD(P)H-hydrate dehydratase [Criibacterium bergeronii]|uniref:ADP-dependent (S)-NAD(P)H-hydrate dehydratase n=1 Tax=Criibacterium bergeronii TaxID=1871336 RepID=A0A552V0Q5_9FIRM|nr:NAD(P)H-hydrate dehydratase [Criibacterium bergeronii]MBS6064056.1 NAD(P)H-hydrate dehydratase [Peptostreptococcaceae bacterium]TRW24049.1 NAD(P)H-hydrate dehydratase [Criibacterium bergeronii]
MITITDEMVKKALPHRDNTFDKRKNGKVLVIAGSDRYPTTGLIVGNAAMRAGAGLVTIATSTYARQIISSNLMEVMSISYEDNKELTRQIEIADTVAIGSGIDRTEFSKELLEKALNYDKKLVIDADGIFLLKNFLCKIKTKDIVITPHESEFSNLIDLSVSVISENRQILAEDFAKKYKIKLLLKGKNTIITDGNNTFLLDKGSYKMATGGMGDCLTGIIAAMSASGISLLDAAISGAYIHSLTADVLSKNMYTVLASDIINNLPYVINDIQNGVI